MLPFGLGNMIIGDGQAVFLHYPCPDFPVADEVPELGAGGRFVVYIDMADVLSTFHVYSEYRRRVCRPQ